MREFIYFFFCLLIRSDKFFTGMVRIQWSNIFRRRRMFLLMALVNSWCECFHFISISCLRRSFIDAFTHDCCWIVDILLLISVLSTFCWCFDCIMHCLEKLSYSAACPIAQFAPLAVGMWSCTYRMIVGQHIWITVKCLASIVLYKFSILYMSLLWRPGMSYPLAVKPRQVVLLSP